MRGRPAASREKWGMAERKVAFPEWSGPELHQNNIRYDESGTIVGNLEAALAKK
jgi:hypothetical protein